MRWEDTHDWLASLAVIGCLCMEAILGDTVFSIHFIGSVTSCVYKIFGARLHDRGSEVGKPCFSVRFEMEKDIVIGSLPKR